MRVWQTDDLGDGLPPPPNGADDYGKTRPPAVTTPIRLVATQFTCRDPRTIPPRQWLFGKHFIRRFVSTTAAQGGLGKTTHSFVEAAAMVSGLPLLGGAPRSPARVWIVNLEDPADELERRMAAVLLHYGLEQQHIGDRLYVDSGRVLPIKLASKVRDDVVVAEPIVAELIREIRDRQIDVLIVDPLVSSHSVPENDNGAIDRVVKTWARIAEETNCAIELIHHVRKPAAGSQSDFTVDDARGAVALIGAVRSARVLNVMSREDAEKAGIDPAQRRSFFRVDDGKSNMTPPVDKAVWRKLVGVPLDNGTADEPGDWVAVAEAWEMPSVFEGLSTSSLRAVQDKIASGDWGENVQASNWAGHAVAEVLEIDTASESGKQRAKTLLRTWLTNKVLRVERLRDGRHGLERPLIRVGDWVSAPPSKAGEE